jgi:Protein kinase domain
MEVDLDSIRQAFSESYVIESLLGHGGMASVYLGRNKVSDRQVAVKVLNRIGASDPEDVLRFKTEARTTARLHHPGIISVLDAGEVSGFFYYVMEFVDGASLQEILKQRGSLAVTDVLAVAQRVTEALTYAHEQGVVHRDIKPSNVFIPRLEGKFQFGDARLTDFGVFGTLNPRTRLTRPGQMFGTPTYMSPEQIRGQEQSAATDIFGLGLVLYEMLYGRRPFEVADDTEYTIIARIVRDPVSFPDLPVIPYDVKEFISRCLSKDPSERPSSPADILGVLLRHTFGKASATVPTRTLGFYFKSRIAKLAAGIVFLVLGIAIVAFRVLVLPSSQNLAELAVGVSLVLGGALVGWGARYLLHKRHSELEEEADHILTGRQTRGALTQTLAIEVDRLMERCRTLDQRFLGTTLAIMVQEYQTANDFDDRQTALVNAVQFFEKLMARTSPWYVRYEKLIASAVALLGIIPGILKIVDALSGGPSLPK